MALGNALGFSVTGGALAASAARDQLREWLAPKLDPGVVEVARLLLSELVTNCVVHGAAARPETWNDIAASIFPRTLWVEVSDGGRRFTHKPRPPSPDARSGRGLYLVEQLSSRWGMSERGTARVWFELPRPSRG
jgi:anti-sigma regulatory factor (Ser/Thr protein kinase)